jgi:hypothetical protein
MLHLQLSAVLFMFLVTGCSGQSTSSQDDEKSHASHDPFSHQMPLDTELAKTKMSCRLVFDWYAPDSLEYTLTDEVKMKELVLAPVEHSTIDEEPAKYVVLGYLVVEVDGRATEEVILFEPFGHIKRNGVYRIADFSALQVFLTERLTGVSTEISRKE